MLYKPSNNPYKSPQSFPFNFIFFIISFSKFFFKRNIKDFRELKFGLGFCAKLIYKIWRKKGNLKINLEEKKRKKGKEKNENFYEFILFFLKRIFIIYNFYNKI